MTSSLVEDDIRALLRDVPTVRRFCPKCGELRDDLADFFTRERAAAIANLIEAARDHVCSDPECPMKAALDALTSSKRGQ